MSVDHGEARGPYPLSDEARALGEWQLAHGVVYRPNKADMDLGHEHWNAMRREWVPAYEPWPGMDRGLFWNGSNY